MWQFEHTITVDKCSKEQIWTTWSDVANWKNWDDDIESSSGSFVSHSTLSIKPKNGPHITASIVCEPYTFTVMSRLPLSTTLEFSHYLTQTPSGTLMTHGIKITGPLTFLFKYLIGRTVEKNLPNAMNKLLLIASSK